MRILFRKTVRVLVGSLILSGVATASRGIAEGEDWLKWDNETRERYVWCYVLAFQHGFQSACKTMKPKQSSVANSRNEAPEERCMMRMPRFSKSIEYYSQKITVFYTANPKGRYVLIRELLDNMIDSRDLTNEQLRDKFKDRMHAP